MYGDILFDHKFFYGHRPPNRWPVKLDLWTKSKNGGLIEAQTRDYPAVINVEFFEEGGAWYFDSAYFDWYKDYHELAGELDYAYLLQVFGLIENVVSIRHSPTKLEQPGGDHIFIPPSPELPDHIEYKSWSMIIKWRDNE